MTTNKTVEEILGDITIDGSNLPSYTVSASTPWVSAGTSSVTWSPSIWTSGGTSDTFTIASPHTKINQGGKLQLYGENADIEINGKSLVAMLERIEQRINLLTVNAELEAEWEELRELGDQYRALEQRIRDKMETWSKLKAADNENK